MNTYANLRYHLMFRTLGSAPLLTPAYTRNLCCYVDGIVKKKRGMILEATALSDHIHLLIGTRPNVAIADMARDLKANTSRWLNENSNSRGWFRWEPGYGAFTVSESQVPKVRRFIQSQHRFHQTTTLEEEFARFVEKHGFEHDTPSGERQVHTRAWLRVHVIFSTKLRMPLIPENLENDLYQSFGRLAAACRAVLVEVGGMPDHVHLVLAPHRSVPLADVLRSMKNESTYWMRQRLGNEDFFAWQRGYGIFSVSLSQFPKVCEYVRRQKEHHQEMSTADELRRLLTEHGLEEKRPPGPVRSPEGVMC